MEIRKRSKNFPKFDIYDIIQKPIFIKKHFWSKPKFYGYENVKIELHIDDKNMARLRILLLNNKDGFKLVPLKEEK